MTDRILSNLGLAYKAGAIVIGTDAVIDAMRLHKATLVIIASDASESTKKRLTDKSRFYSVTTEQTNYTVCELGTAFGKSACACIAICGENFTELYRQSKQKTAEVN